MRKISKIFYFFLYSKKFEIEIEMLAASDVNI